MAPTLTASYVVHSAGADNTTLTTTTFTPSNGEVICVKACTWDTASPMATPTGGSQTYTAAKIAAPGGFAGWAGCWVATVSGSPVSMSVSCAPGNANNSRHSMVVERWTSAQVAATPAVNATAQGTGTFSTPLTTVSAGSLISWVMSEANSINPATRAYLLSATEETIFDGHTNSDGVFYFAYTATQSPAGSYSFGLSAPTGLNWTAAGVEIQAAAVASGPAPAIVIPPTAVIRAYSW